MFGKAGLFLIEIDRHKVKFKRCMELKTSNMSNIIGSFPPERQTMTVSPSSSILKSVRALPTKRRNFLCALFFSYFCFGSKDNEPLSILHTGQRDLASRLRVKRSSAAHQVTSTTEIAHQGDNQAARHWTK